MYVQPQQNTHLQNQVPNPPQHNTSVQQPTHLNNNTSHLKNKTSHLYNNLPHHNNNLKITHHNTLTSVLKDPINHPTLTTWPKDPHIYKPHNIVHKKIVGQQGYNIPPHQMNAPSDDVTLQIQNLNPRILDTQLGKLKKSYALQDICPYPFDHYITMIPFLENFEIPKFDKYRGRGDPIEHAQEFLIAISHRVSTLQLFSGSLIYHLI